MIAGANSKSVTLTGSTSITDWATTTVYSVGNYVQTGAIIYKCIVAHTSGTFATDLSAGKWLRMDDETVTAIAMAIAIG
jgi:hypothetical protein